MILTRLKIAATALTLAALTGLNGEARAQTLEAPSEQPVSVQTGDQQIAPPPNLNGVNAVRNAGNCFWNSRAGEFLTNTFKCRYTYKNNAIVRVNYSASEDVDGLTIVGASNSGTLTGSLAPGASKTFTFEPNFAANNIAPGTSRTGKATIKVTGFLFSDTPELTMSLTALKWPGDDIASASAIPNTLPTSFGNFNNARYTTQSFEPKHFPGITNNRTRSRWFKWVAPSTGQVRFSTNGSTANDTVLSVYRSRFNTPLTTQLVQIVSDDNSGTGNDSLVYFHAISGRTYYFAVAAKNTAAATGSYTINGVGLSGAGTGLLASVLPVARAVRNSQSATAFATMINTSSSTATNCNIQSSVTGSTYPPREFAYQRVNSANVPVGTVNETIDIPAGGTANFVFAVTPKASTGSNLYRLPLVFDCSNKAPVASKADLNTFIISSDSVTPADMVSAASTIGNNGIVDIPGNTGTGAFATAVVNNNGPTRTIRATADFGGATLPAVLSVCRTNPSTGICINTPSTNVVWSAAGNTPYTFTVFVKGTGRIPFNPFDNRVFLRFFDTTGPTLRGATSVAVRTR